VNPKDGLKYLWIPPGRCAMGCSAGDGECAPDEKPAHEAVIERGFWLGETPVTQAAWRRVTGSNPSNFKGDDLPVEQIPWEEAQRYCQAIGGRLPTEIEWEYAARAGTTGAHYGVLDEVAWYANNSRSRTHPVRQKKPNAFFLYDILGNVWQWTIPAEPADASTGILRGGSWGSYPVSVRVSHRYSPAERMRNWDIGLRCAAD